MTCATCGQAIPTDGHPTAVLALADGHGNAGHVLEFCSYLCLGSYARELSISEATR